MGKACVGNDHPGLQLALSVRASGILSYLSQNLTEITALCNSLGAALVTV
jgi:hypothetical protein